MCAAVSAAHADRVEVASPAGGSAPVFLEPSPSSALVGRLGPGEDAFLLDSEDGWHRVALRTERIGYVLASRTRVVPEGKPFEVRIPAVQDPPVSLQPAIWFDIVTEELPSGSVNDVVQDQRGFIWLGTETGLVRMVGTDISVFKPGDGRSSTIPHSYVRALAAAPNGDVWIGTVAGLSRFDAEAEEFVHYLDRDPETESQPDSAILSLTLDSTGHLWVGTNGDGVKRLDPRTGEFTHYNSYDQPYGISFDTITVVHAGKDDAIWLGTHGGGVNRLDPATGKVAIYEHDPDNPASLSDNHITSLMPTRDGMVWIGTPNDGINRLDPTTGVVKRFDEPSKATVVFEDSAGTLWATSAPGLYRWDPSADRFEQVRGYKDGYLCMRGVRGMYEDRGGILWIATGGAGVCRFHRSHLQFGLTTQFDNPSGIASGPDGYMWTATRNGLARVSLADRTATLFRPISPEQEMHWAPSLTFDHRGHLWAGTVQESFYHFDPTSATFTFYRPEVWEFAANGQFNVHAVLPRPDGKVWLGTWGAGFGLFDPATGELDSFVSGGDEPYTHIYALHQDRSDPDALWIGTGAFGLCRFSLRSGDVDCFRHDPSDPESLSDNAVLAVVPDDNGGLWLATPGGLDRFDRATGRARRFTEKDGLADNLVYGIVRDDHGYLWIGTNRGLSRYDPVKGGFETFDQRHGALPQYHQGGYRRLPGGYVAFTGPDGFIAFRSADIQPRTYMAPVALTGFHVFGAPRSIQRILRERGRIELSYLDSLFTVEFAATDYSDPTGVRYRYMLEGVHDDWITTRSTSVTYSNLESGNYVFRVTAEDRRGRQTGEEFRAPIHISTAPWKSWWAYVAYVLLAVGLVVWLIRRSRARIRRLQEANRLAQLERDLALAGTLQSFFMPDQTIYREEGLTVHGFSRPADTCGGDWWWHETTPEDIYILVVGDVTGHGLAPAFLTACVASTYRTQRRLATEYARNHRDNETNGASASTLPDLLAGIHSDVVDITDGNYWMSMSVVELDLQRGHLKLYSAGGLPLFVQGRTGAVRTLVCPGRPLGSERFRLGEREHQLEPGDRVFVLTDGLPETLTESGREWGMRRVLDIVRTTRDDELDEVLRRVIEGADRVRSGAQLDDITLVVLEWNGR